MCSREDKGMSVCEQAEGQLMERRIGVLLTYKADMEKNFIVFEGADTN